MRDNKEFVLPMLRKIASLESKEDISKMLVNQRAVTFGTTRKQNHFETGLKT